MSTGNKMFCLSDYDAYGFDLDHTLAKFNLVPLFRLIYDGLVDFLIKERGYSSELHDDIKVHKDFICKGLFLDSDKGNILKLSHGGKILKVSHGSRMMEVSEVKAAYGEEMLWEHYGEARSVVRSHGADYKYRFFENFFDVPAVIVAAHIVDIIDKQNGGPLEKYDFWKDIIAAFEFNYMSNAFSDTGGYVFPELKKNRRVYYQESSEGVKTWLRDLKRENKCVFLVTSSKVDFASHTAESVLGLPGRMSRRAIAMTLAAVASVDRFGSLLHYTMPFIYVAQEHRGTVFPTLIENPSLYYQPCSPGVHQWLKDLRRNNKCVFLITSSHIDFADLTATMALGKDWRSYFDIVITHARKPGFFRDDKPFLSLDGIKESDSVPWDQLKPHEIYSGGNHTDMEKLIAAHTGHPNPKIVYFGDSLCSDAFPAKSMAKWDVVLVLEEMEAEGYHPKDNTHHYWQPEEKKEKFIRDVNLDVDPEEEAYLLSSIWGSFFYHPEEDPKHDRHMNTYWGEIITKYSDIAIPSIEYLAGLPLDHQFKRFNHEEDGNTDGFIPAKPKPLL